MQHYRLPTRLLDWSESPLTALFFAVEAHPEDEAIVWCLNPHGLSSRIGQIGIASPEDPAAVALIGQPFALRAQTSDVVLPMLGDEVDLRMLMQLSTFTLHGNARPLELRAESQGILTAIHIPAESKLLMQGMLEVLGVRRSSLFPDLEGLSRELAAVEWRFDAVPPTPKQEP